MTGGTQVASITLTTEIPQSARTAQLAGMFDYNPDGKQTLTWRHELPLEAQPWQIGLIVGPSGSGKSVLARHIWGDRVREGHDWSDRPMIEDFPEHLSIKDITATLSSVGFGTVPAWLRPYGVLSNGEKFRADMARSLLGDDQPIVIDEFTSVVDRQVATIASHAVQKSIRRTNRRFVAVTCHYDVENWLQPDWVYDVAAQEFRWRLVQPHPPVELAIHKCSRAVWPLFEPHHYMSADLHKAAQCFAAYLNGRPVAFTSYRHLPHPKTRDIKMGHRLVVLPDHQGIGIANALETWLGEYLHARGYRYRNVVAHPGMIQLYSASRRWRNAGPQTRPGVTTTTTTTMAAGNRSTRRLAVRSFEYVPLPKEAADAYLRGGQDP